jgi:hypothetical protein
MAHESTITTYHSTTATNVPTLAVGELGVNIADRKLWVGSAGGRVSLGVFDSGVEAPSLTSITSWVGNSAGTRGVSTFELDLGGGNAFAILMGTTKAAPTVTATPVLLQGTTVTVNATTGNLNLLGVGIEFNSSTGGMTFDAQSVINLSSQTAINLQSAAGVARLIVPASGFVQLASLPTAPGAHPTGTIYRDGAGANAALRIV